ncbi:MAG: alcohol dehydrogenase [Methyloligellaceae bacterium]
MKSYALVGFGQPLQEIESADPVPQGTEVLIKVRRCGVCHSDIHISEGYFDFGDGQKFRMTDRGMELPTTLGHEVLGEVIAAGPDAEEAPIGKTMLVHPWIGCGTCRACREERENDCATMKPIGVLRDGGYATHVIVPDPKFLVDVEGIDPTIVTPYACSGVTVYTALKKALPVEDDEWLCIMGAGGLGLTAVSIAKAMGADQIVSVDIDDEKLAVARDMGATEVLNPKTCEDPVATLTEMTGGMLLAAVDTVGSEQTSRLGILSLRKTGRYVVVGLYGGALKIPMPILPLKALTVRGSYVGSCRDLRELIELVKAGKVKPIPVATRPLDQADVTLRDLAAGKIVGRVVLTTD